MNRVAAYCYGISAVCIACIIETATDSAFWAARPVVGALLGATIPFCIGTGWLLEHRPIKAHSLIYKISCGVSITLGLAAISAFLFSVAGAIGAGFVGGVFFALLSINMLTDRIVGEYTKQNPERQKTDD